MKKQNFSRQRKAVFDAVRATREHPTAEMVYNALKEEDPKISLATVYRNLHILSDDGKIKRVSIPGRSDRYDGFTGEHVHLCCTSCGRIIDIEGLDTFILDDEIERISDFQIQSKDIICEGLCKDCK